MTLHVRRLGRVGYEEAWTLQRSLAQSGRGDYLLVLEHPPVYTLGARADRANVLVDPATVGAELVDTDRGGDVTFHGPGQLVMYPIISLPDDPGAGPAHVHRLEDVVIAALRDLGLEARRLEGYPGVWIDSAAGRPAKIAAVGIRTVRRTDDEGRDERRSLHGIALNVSTDLSMFGHIVPCGIADYGVTSLQAEGVTADLDAVADVVVARFLCVFGPSDTTEQAVTGPARHGIDTGERPLTIRLRRAGVDPDASIALHSRKPEWLRVNATMGPKFVDLDRTLHSRGLVTVCEEAGCPNIFECWREGTATFMVNGSRCTRACGFCLIDTSHPLPLDPTEPERVADAVVAMGLAHAVVTCVARDDLADGGAGAIASTVDAIRAASPSTAVEILVSDCKGDAASLDQLIESRPDVFNHNIETVARLQRAVRPSAGYARSLSVLARAAEAGLVVKSGLMVGLGERDEEVRNTLVDLASVGVAIATIGQYLRPTGDHLPVARYVEPSGFAEFAEFGRSVGLAHVESSPLTRSSYHAHSAATAAKVELRPRVAT